MASYDDDFDYSDYYAFAEVTSPRMERGAVARSSLAFRAEWRARAESSSSLMASTSDNQDEEEPSLMASTSDNEEEEEEPSLMASPSDNEEEEPEWDFSDFYAFAEEAEDLEVLPTLSTMIGYKEPIAALAEEYQSSGNSKFLEKIKLISDKHVALRPVRKDGNSFIRSFLFSYLENILEQKDLLEVKRITAIIDHHQKMLARLGVVKEIFENFAESRLQINSVVYCSRGELMDRCSNPYTFDSAISCFRYIIMGEMIRRSEYFGSLMQNQSNETMDQHCRTSVVPLGIESGYVHVRALSDALGVQIHLSFLEDSDEGCEEFLIPCAPSVSPFVITLLCRQGTFEVLYPKSS